MLSCLKRIAPQPIFRLLAAGNRSVCRVVALAVGLGIWGLATAIPVSAQETEVDAAAVRQYNLAVGLQNKKLYAQAEQRWVKYIAAYPKDPRLPDAHHYLGICQLQEQKFPEAAATFRAVLAKFPKFPSADASQFNLGLVLYNVAAASNKPEDWKAAHQAFSDVVTKFPQSKQIPAALYYQGECSFSNGELPAAIAAYQKLITSFPQSPLLPEVYYALGTTQQDSDLDAEAAQTFQTFLKKFPNDAQAPECKLRLGLSLFKQAKYTEAEPIFGQMAGLAEFNLADFALLRQAQCLNLREQYPQAADLYESLPKKFTDSPYIGAALLAAGKCRFNAEQFPQAQANLTAVVNAKGEESAESAYWLARTLVKLMKAGEAVTVLDQALAAYPKSPFRPRLTFARVDALYEQPERRKETIPLYLNFAATFPDDELAPKAVYMASLTALQLEDFAAAQAHSAAFLANAKFAKHPLTPDVLFVGGEGFLLATPPEPVKAEPLYRRVVAEYPEHGQVPQSQVRIGLCLQLAEKYDPAVAHLTQVLPALKDPELTAEAQLLIGRAHTEAMRVDPAIVAFQAALTAKPDWTRGDEVLLALAVNQRGKELLPEAVASLQKLNTSYPMSPYRDQAFYQLGEIGYQTGKFDEAVQNYQQVVAQFPEAELAPLAQYGVGWSLFGKESFPESVQAFSALLTKYPQAPIAARGKYVRGLAYRRLMQFEPAIKDLTEFVATKPEEKDALEARYAIGLCQVGLKQFGPAAATFTALLKEKPDYPEADKVWYELAYAYQLAEKEKEAADAFEQLASKFPESPKTPESWFRVGEYQEKQEKYPEADKAYAAGLAKAMDPGLRERTQYKLGWVRYQSEKFAEGAAILQEQLKEFPKGELLLPSTFLVGECFFRQEKFDTALPFYAQVIAAKSPEADKALYRSGTCAKNLKNWPASQQHFSALLQQFPKYELVSEARYGLGLSLQMQQKLDEAKSVYEKVTQETNSETAARSRFMIGECTFAQKKFDEAIEHFLEVAVGYPYENWQAEGYFEAGRCFIELKEPEKAKETLDTIVKKFPEHPRVKDAMSLIANLKTP